MRSSTVVFARTAIVLLLAVWAVPAVSQTQIDAGAIRLEYSWGESFELAAESFELAEGVTMALTGLPIEAHALLLNFPVAPGERADVELERVDVYAADARIWVVDEDGTREIERSPRAHFLGTVTADPSVRLGLSIDPDGGNLTGMVSHRAGFFELVQLPTNGASGDRPVYEVGTGLSERLGMDISTSCRTPEHVQFFDPAAVAAAVRAGEPVPNHDATLHQATIAFDTDGEFVNDPQNYNGDTAAATTAIGNWVTGTNVIYERDLGMRLAQGETVLRTNTASDPYVSMSTGTQLDEVGNWWEANMAAVSRVFVALLSGKGPSSGGGCGGAGIAWVDSYCEKQSLGGSYSATQILRCVPLGGADNVNLVGHEVGHNSGSGHTHCYSPPVDQCYNAGGAGCWGGAPSCPDHSAVIAGITPGKGTVMSYCNFGPPSGADCGSSDPFFHPTVIARIKQSITDNTNPMCVTHATATCSVGVNDKPVSGMDTGTVVHEACNSITFSNYTANGNVTATAPSVVMNDNVTLGGTFTANNAVP